MEERRMEIKEERIDPDLVKRTAIDVYDYSDGDVVLVGAHTALPGILGHRLMRRHGNHLDFLSRPGGLEKLSRRYKLYRIPRNSTNSDRLGSIWFENDVGGRHVTVALSLEGDPPFTEEMYRAIVDDALELAIDFGSSQRGTIRVARPEYTIACKIDRLNRTGNNTHKRDVSDVSTLLVASHFLSDGKTIADYRYRADVDLEKVAEIVGTHYCGSCGHRNGRVECTTPLYGRDYKHGSLRSGSLTPEEAIHCESHLRTLDGFLQRYCAPGVGRK